MLSMLLLLLAEHGGSSPVSQCKLTREGAHRANGTSAAEPSAVMREKRSDELVSGRRRAIKTGEGGKTFRLNVALS